MSLKEINEHYQYSSLYDGEIIPRTFARYKDYIAETFPCYIEYNQERLSCFLLNLTVYSCAYYNYLYTQITQRNPVKRQKGGQKVAKESESNIILI